MTGGNKKIRRFSRGRIVEHWLHVMAFTILVVTGLSQKFYGLEVSQWFILQMGGIEKVRWLHHLTGLAFTALVTLHISTGIIGVVFLKWQPSMAISSRDFRDAVRNIKYYLGIYSHPAPCERFSYKQKFEYWNVVMGGVLMVVSGLVLMFPLAVTHLLPGEIVPAAKVLHTNEALLVLLIVAVWHIYNSIFSPEVFPLSTSIFTGFISRRRMLQEHPMELARIENRPVEEVLEEGLREL